MNISILKAAGFYVGPRDPSRNTDFSGAFMVAQDTKIGPTKDASTGGFCVVGDDLEQLVAEAVDVFFGTV